MKDRVLRLFRWFINVGPEYDNKLCKKSILPWFKRVGFTAIMIKRKKQLHYYMPTFRRFIMSQVFYGLLVALINRF